MVAVHKLEKLEMADLRRLNAGYTSLQRYIVHKVESAARTVITLELETLAQPYVKRWETLEDDFKRYQRVIGGGFSLGAFDGERMVALALAEPQWWNRSLWVWEFHVEESWQRQGIGRRLMDTLAERASLAGLRVLVCETQNTNLPAIQFYRSTGFEVDGVDLSYYTNRDLTDGEVAVFMKRKLGASNFDIK